MGPPGACISDMAVRDKVKRLLSGPAIYDAGNSSSSNRLRSAYVLTVCTKNHIRGKKEYSSQVLTLSRNADGTLPCDTKPL